MSEAILPISSILSYLIKQTRMSEAALAKKINVPRATINRLVSGRTPDPRASTLNSIAAYFGVSMDQLLGKQPLFLDNHQLIIASTISIPIIEWKEIKIWEKVVSKVKPNEHLGWITLDSSIEQSKFAVRVKGESMWPQFQLNSILIIAPEKEIKNRDFVLAYIEKDDEVVFRQLIIENKYKLLKAINNIFPPIQLECSDRIIGVVIQTRNNYS